MDEWDRYVEDQKYARSLRWKAEAGHVRGLLIAAAVVLAAIAVGFVLIARVGPMILLLLHR